MTVSTQLSALTLALGVAFSGSAFATGNIWDTPNPWGSATLSQFAGWDSFGGTTDTTPDTGAGGTVKENTGTSFVTSGGNIYSFATATNFTATLAGSTTGLFDVYLRVGTIGTTALSAATLNGVSATSTVAFSQSQGDFGGFGESTEQELFWKWSNVSASSLYSFNFGSSSSSLSLDQLALATVAVAAPVIPSTPVSAVPEPETYAMMLAGLGLMGFSARRRSSK